MNDLRELLRLKECRVKLYLTGALFDRTRQFYEDTLQWRVRHAWDRGPKNRGVMFRLTPIVTLELVDHGPDRTIGDSVGLSVAVPDVWRLHADLSRRLPQVRPLHDQIWGDTDFKLADPSGFVITYYSPTTGVSQY